MVHPRLGGFTTVLFLAVWRSVISPCPFSIYLAGATGVGKSELAALAQQFFGPEPDAKNLPGSFLSTANALEGQAFALKDALFVVDDFAPPGSAQDMRRKFSDLDRLLRAQGNQAGRARMRADASLRRQKQPRCTIIITGEDLPETHSIRARALILEIDQGMVDFARLGHLQRVAADGLFAMALAGYLQWLAPKLNRVREEMPSTVARYSDDAAQPGQHPRTPEAIAHLAFGLEQFL